MPHSALRRVTDPQRLEALRRTTLLDSPPQVEFDRLTSLAAKLLQCPTSIVSLVDVDRQYFKSCVGLAEPWASKRETPLSHSFCRIAVESDAPLIVHDSHTDPRVQNNPAVSELGVRAYAGVPIRTRTGDVLGSFCVIDGVAREWTDSDMATLETLAASVESEIELIELTSREREQHQFLQAIVDASPLAIAVVDENRTVRLWNHSAERILGHAAKDVQSQPLPEPLAELISQSGPHPKQPRQATTDAFDTYTHPYDGRTIYVRVITTELPVFSGQAGHSLLLFDDVSEGVLLDQERDRLLTQLKDEVALRRMLLDQLPAGVIEAEVPTGRIVSLNAAAKEIIGGELPDDLTPASLEPFTGYHSDGRPYSPEEWPLARTIYDDESVTNEEILFESLDGQHRTLLVSSNRIKLTVEGHARAIATFTDISELKESEAARHLSEEKARRIIDSSHDCIKILDLDGHLLSMSPGGQRLLEIEDVGQFCGLQWTDFWKGDDNVQARRAVQRARAGKSGRFRGVCPTMRNGYKKWWDVIVTPILGEEGQPEQLLSISRDVTEEVLAAEEREALIHREVKARMDAEIAREKYRNLVNGLDAIVWEADANTWEFNFVSKRAEEILGYPIEEWLGNPDFWPGIIHPEDREASVTYCKTACEECRDHDFEYRARTRDGGTVWLRDIVYVVPDEEGRPHHLRGVMVDVTAKKNLERELRAQAQELKEMDERKNEFLAVLAHELRNPLAPIGNAAELLKFCSDDPDQIAEIRETLQGQVSQLVRLIDDLMDISRITRGKIQLQKETVSIREVLETAAAAVRPACEVQRHRLRCRLDEAGDLAVEGDRVRLAQVFTNILNNACKYTPEGGEIELRCHPVDDDVEILVEDNGIGISNEDADNIFEMFTQVESSITRSQGGLGIGLTLVRQLVELHDGSVSLDRDRQSPGSCFIVRLPLAHTNSPTNQQQTPGRSTDALDVLIIDDVPAVGKMLGRLVEAMGHRASVTTSADEGISRAIADRPQIVFSDICMPEKSGYEVAAELRRLPQLSQSMIIAMTGNGQPEDIRKAMEAGFHRHLVKPASVDTLQSVFDEFRSQNFLSNDRSDRAGIAEASEAGTK